MAPKKSRAVAVREEQDDDLDVPDFESISSVGGDRHDDFGDLDAGAVANQVQAKMRLMTVDRRPVAHPLTRTALVALMRNLLVSHRYSEGLKVLQLISKDRRISHEAIFRSAMVIMARNRRGADIDEYWDKTYEAFFKPATRLDLNKREMILENLFVLLCDQNLDKAKSYLEEYDFITSRTGKGNMHRQNRFIDPLVACYIQYVEYVIWLRKIESLSTISSQPQMNYELEKMASDIVVRMETAINSGPPLNTFLDIFVHSCVAINRFYGRPDEACNLLNNTLKNGNYLTPLLLKCAVLGDMPSNAETSRDRRNILDQIFAISPSEPIVLKGESLEGSEDGKDYERSAKKLMEHIDYQENRLLSRAWITLVRKIKRLSARHRDEFDSLKVHYVKLHHDYWQKYHFNLEQLRSPSREVQRCLFAKACFASIMQVCEEFVVGVNEHLDREEQTKLEKITQSARKTEKSRELGALSLKSKRRLFK